MSYYNRTRRTETRPVRASETALLPLRSSIAPEEMTSREVEAKAASLGITPADLLFGRTA